jgi:Ca-activated chloride channel homolog
MANCVVSGRVTNSNGAPEAAVLVRIDALNVGANTMADGTYRLVIPESRLPTQKSVGITASRAGFTPQSRTITVSQGAELTENFQIQRGPL